VNPYNYLKDENNITLRLKKKTVKLSRYEVSFPVAFQTCYEESNLARAEYYKPASTGKVPLAILIHGWGDHSIIPIKWLAGSLLKQGIACMLLYLPFHTSRLPEEIKKRLPRLTQDEWFKGYRIAVTDVRQIVDWAYLNEDIDEQRIAAVGLSLGGIISSITMGVDERIKTGAFIVTGGNSGKIVQLSKLAGFSKDYKRSEEEYREIQDSYYNYLERIAQEGFENVEPDRQSFLTDPMTFAHILKDRDVMMLNARWDEFIPRESATDFWNACGRCAIHWYPTTHGTIWLWYPSVASKITRFLQNSFDLNK